MILHLKIVGWLLMLLATIHIMFPRYFNWKAELKDVSLINRQMMYIHTLFIGLMVLLMGALCISATADLLFTPLGNKICLGLCAFWSTRLVIQFTGYSSTLWKGKPFETWMHVVFTFIWAYVSGVFGVACWRVYG
ncbi:MAG: hypothetical protein EOO01_25340 [Chitinophagaceae bacterium]|nr:MAG: hypothetical protein EOO01_25340 [Chitinophagaceae bacterium]